MAWIESHQKLKDEPKLFILMASQGWSKAEAIGRLHLFWWWCVDHAEDGDLRRFNDAHLAIAVELNPNEGTTFIESMSEAGFLEREPYFRIANWWKYVSHFLKRRYKDSREKWEKVEKLYSNPTPVLPERPTKPTKPTKPKEPAKATPALQAALDEVFKQGFNIYALMGQFKKQSKLREPIPDEVLLAVCESFKKNKPTDHWPYFKKVLLEESRNYFARRNIAEHEWHKNAPVAQSVQDIIASMGK